MTLELSCPSGPRIELLYVSATFSAYDSAGVAVISAQPIGTKQFYNGGNTMQVRYMVDARPNQTVTVAGVYKYTFTVKMSDGDTQVFEATGLISSTP